MTNLTTRSPWRRVLCGALSTLVTAGGLAVTASPPASAAAPTGDPVSTGAGDAGLGAFGTTGGDPMDGYRLYEVPTGQLMSDYYSIDALGPHGEVAGRSLEGDNRGHLTPFVWVPGKGATWLDPVPYSVNRVGGFDAQGNVYGTAADGTPTVDEVVVWKWTREQDGYYSAPQAIFHGDVLGKDWSGEVTGVNAAGDVLLGNGQPAVIRKGQATVLNQLPGTISANALDINDKGQVVGSSQWPEIDGAYDEPTTWNGGPTSLGFPPLVHETAVASVVNNKGEAVVGDVTADQDPWLRRTDGTFRRFVEPAGAPAGALQRVDDLDDRGTAVGYYQADPSTPAYATVWTREGQRVQKMDDLLLGDSERWHLSRAFAVNDAGMIAGVGRHDGRKVAWVAVPVDPVMFVHGAGASSLYSLGSDGEARNEAWMDCSVSRQKMSLWPEDLKDGTGIELSAIDALRHTTCFGLGELVNDSLNVYGSLLDRLRGSYVEYDRHRRPRYQTEAGCDTSQMSGAQTPNLFVYAYDWRKDNRDNAAGLAEYMRCVKKFWPGSKVDVVTHSMGSLVARRYLMDQGGDDVDRMITIGAPWLGAPKLVNVLQTGDFAPQPVNGDAEIIKHVVGSFPAAHQLAASKLYAEASTVPIVLEKGWDLNGDGDAWGRYDYEQVKQLLDRQNPTFKPGTTGDLFQNETGKVGGQTDWRGDTSGVAFSHVVGLQAGANTIGSVVAVTDLQCTGDETDVRSCTRTPHVEQRLICGDGTVPLVSAQRAGKGVDYNAADAEVITVRSGSVAANQGAEHTGLASNDKVQTQILRRLFSPMVDGDHDGRRDPVAQDHSRLGLPGADEDSCYQPPATQGLAASSAYDAGHPAPGTALRYASLVGGTGLTLSDSAGHSTDPQGETAGWVDGVTLYPSDREDAAMATFPFSETVGYTASFTGTGRPVSLELLDGSQARPTHAVRWTDVPVAKDQAVRLRVLADGRQVLEVDADGNGTPEKAVTPTAVLGGADAADTTAPVVTATRIGTPDGVRFGLAATDTGSGVGDLAWSTDGTHFRAYDGPVAVAPGSVLTAFATDRAGNRSAPYSFEVDAVESGLLTTATVTPKASTEGWVAGTATVTLRATAPDGGKVASIAWRTSGAAGAQQRTVDGAVAELEVDAVGATTVTFAATAADGTVEPERTAQVRIDQKAPAATVKQPTPGAVVSSLPALKGTASDDASGVTRVELELRNNAGEFWDGEAWTSSPTWVGAAGTTTWSRVTGLPSGTDLPTGGYRLRVRASDGAGHSAVAADTTFTVAPTAGLTVRRLTTPVGSRAQAYALNERGVAGGIGLRAVRWRNGDTEELPLTGVATRAAVYAIDDEGTAYGTQSGDGSDVEPVRWGSSPATPSVLPTLGGAGEVRDVTPDGSVLVGSATSIATTTPTTVPVRWVGGKIERLPLLSGATSGSATGVAADGTVVGTLTTSSGSRAVIWPAAGGVRSLGVLPQHLSSGATAINDLGVVVGSSTDSNGWTHGFTWSDGEMEQIYQPLDMQITRNVRPLSIDNTGTVVGEYTPGGNDPEQRAFTTRADGSMVDLTAQLPSGSGWTLLSAHKVNEQGQVVGFGRENGTYQAFLLGRAHAPVAQDQGVATPKDTAVTIELPGYDPDVADQVRWSVLDEPTHGSLGEVVDGRVTYTPAAGFEGTDRFTWQISDPDYSSVPATVAVTVGRGEPAPDPDPEPDPDPVPDAPPTIEVTAPAAGDEGSAVPLHATVADPEGKPLEVTWSVTGGVLAGNGSDTSLTLPDGPGSVTVTASTTDGTTPVSATAVVDVRNVPPAAEAGDDLTVAPGVAALLKGSASDPSAKDAGGLTSRWDFGDGTTSTGLMVSHSWKSAGTYTVRFTVTDPDGASTTDTLKVTVSSKPAPTSVLGLVGVQEGAGTFAAYSDGRTARGTVAWAGKGGAFLASVTKLERLTTSTGKPAVWIDGTYGKHTVRIYAESGLFLGIGDVFKLWVDGKLVTSTGKRTYGAVLIC
jgi:probable HAF family extracellular repeat protein